MKKKSMKRRVLGHGDFFVDIKIKNMFGTTLFKQKGSPFYKALDDMLFFDKTQNRGKKKGLAALPLILIISVIIIASMVGIYKYAAYTHLQDICNPECIDIDSYSSVLPKMFENTKEKYEKGIFFSDLSNALLIPLLLFYGCFMYVLHENRRNK